MSEDNDKSDDDKTEEPTQKRLEDASDKGDIPFSREILHWTVLAGSFCLILWVYPFTLEGLLRKTRAIFERCGDEVFSNPSSLVVKDLFLSFGLVELPLFGLVALLILVGLSQSKLNFSFDPVKPKFSKLSPFEGLGRIFGKKPLLDFLKNFIKMSIVAAALVWYLMPYIHEAGALVNANMNTSLLKLNDMMMTLFITLLCVLGFISLLDYLHIHFQFLKRQRMTKQEVKDETKEQEGSPQIKARLRDLRIQRVRSQIASRVKQATVVITNPTHYAIAIYWEQDAMDTPIVVAKGTDFMAQAIRKIATENTIPLVENPPLARSLYATIEVDQPILPEHYKAVAEVIRFVMNLKNKRF